MQITMNDMTVINQILGEHKNDKMPIKTAYKFNKLLMSMENDFKFFQDKYREIIMKYARKKDDGELYIDENNNFIVDNEFTEAYANEMNELFSTKIDVPDLTFTLDELENIEITIQEVGALDSIIKE